MNPATQRPMTQRPEGVPTFSIVVETENLAALDPEELIHVLDDLARQDLSPVLANEVFLFESGDVPLALLARLRAAYPWIRIERLDGAEGYFEAKMIGARRATGELIVLCDSDCRYGPDWLRAMLLTIAAHPEIAVLSGETSVRVAGPYGLALALVWSFPAYSGRRDLYRAKGYNANGAVLRREVLLRCPIPERMTVYRGNGAFHIELLKRMGYILWCQPNGRVLHPHASQGFSQFIWRWLLYGHDQLLTEQAAWANRFRPQWAVALFGGFIGLLKIFSLISWKPLRRLPGALREDTLRRLFYLPAALVMILCITVLSLAGFIAGCIRPGALVEPGARRLHETAEKSKQSKEACSS